MKMSQVMMNNVIRKYGMESKQALAFCRECAKRPLGPEKSVFIRAMYKKLMEGNAMEQNYIQVCSSLQK